MTEIPNPNQDSLGKLTRAVRNSEGAFSLIFASCNYGKVRESIQGILKEALENPQEIHLPPTSHKVFDLIKEGVGKNSPSSVIVLDLERVERLDDVLTAMNGDRDQFKEFCFPVVLWITDIVLEKLVKLAPDFKNIGSVPIFFRLSAEEVIGFLDNFSEVLFEILLDKNLDSIADDINDKINSKLGYSIHLTQELDSALRDLEVAKSTLDKGTTAGLQLAYGREAERKKQLDEAINYYQKSLEYWQQIGDLQRQGLLEWHLGLACGCQATLKRSKQSEYWEQEKIHLQKSLEHFEAVGRSDLALLVIIDLGKVLLNLAQWQELKDLVEKKAFSESYLNNQNDLKKAQNYGFLATVALRHSNNAQEGKRWAQEALALLTDQPSHQGQYLLLQAQSEDKLGETAEAIEHLKEAEHKTLAQNNPLLYIEILKTLRDLYFKDKKYSQAFEYKQKRQAIEAQYRFRAFIGATSLSSEIRDEGENGKTITIAQAIEVSGRKKDVESLQKRLSGDDTRLTIVHGPSGAGKSSLINGGLIPSLEQKTFFIKSMRVKPISLKNYGSTKKDDHQGPDELRWLEEIGKGLSLPIDSHRSMEAILAKLQENSQSKNFVIVLIFDQFEEFFFNVRTVGGRTNFFKFLVECLRISFTYVILSLREDYLHYLLEGERLLKNSPDKSPDLWIINDILNSNKRSELKNFSIKDAKKVIEELTERSQFEIEPELLSRLVQDLAGDAQEIRPIELQIVGAQLQEQEIKTLQSYEALGKNPKEKIVQNYLEKVVEDCGPDNKKAADLVLFLLTDENSTRPLKTINDLKKSLESLLASDEISKLQEVLDIFVKSGLVILLPESPFGRYQLVHDYLAALIQTQKGQDFEARIKEAKSKQKKAEQALEKLDRAYVELKEKEDELNRSKEAKQEAEKVQRKAQEEASKAVQAQEDAEIAQRKAQEDAIKAVQAQGDAEQAKLNAEIASQQTQRGKQRLVHGIAAFSYATLLGILGLFGWAAYNNNQNILAKSERTGYKNIEESDKKLNPSFIQAMLNGQDMHKLINGNTKLSEYPFFSPVSALNNTLKSISYIKNYFPVEEYIASISYSPKSDDLLIATESGNLYQYKPTNSPIERKLLHGGDSKDPFSSVSYSPKTGTWLAATAKNGKLYLWKNGESIKKSYVVLRQRNGKQLLDGEQLLEGEQLLSVAFSPDEKWLAASSSVGKVYLWQKNVDGKWQKQENSIKFDASKFCDNKSNSVSLGWVIIPSDIKPINSISFSKNNELALASSSGCVAIYNLNNIYKPPTIVDFQASVRSISFSPDGQWLVAGLQGYGFIGIWNVDSEEKFQYKPHDDTVTSISFNKDGKLATASLDSTTKLWELKSHEDDKLKEVVTNKVSITNAAIFTGVKGKINSTAFSVDGNSLAIGSSLGDLQIIDLKDALDLVEVSHTNKISDLSVSHDSQYLASVSSDNTAKLWKRKSDNSYSYEQEEDIKGVPLDVSTSISFHPTDLVLLLTSKKGIYRYYVDRKEPAKLLSSTQAQGNISFSKNGELIAFVSEAEVSERGKKKKVNISIINIINYPSGTLKSSFPITNKECHSKKTVVLSIAFSQDKNSKYLATSDTDSKVCIWDSSSRQLLSSISIEPKSVVSSVSFSPDGKPLLLLSSGNNTASLWNLNDSQKPIEVAVFEGHRDAVTQARFSPIPNLIATASNDNTSRLWTWKDDDKNTDWWGWTRNWWGLTRKDNNDQKKGREVAKFDGHTSWLTSLVFTPDGKMLVTGSWDNSIRFWQIPNLETLIRNGCKQLEEKSSYLATTPYYKKDYEQAKTQCKDY